MTHTHLLAVSLCSLFCSLYAVFWQCQQHQITCNSPNTSCGFMLPCLCSCCFFWLGCRFSLCPVGKSLFGFQNPVQALYQKILPWPHPRPNESLTPLSYFWTLLMLQLLHVSHFIINTGFLACLLFWTVSFLGQGLYFHFQCLA